MGEQDSGQRFRTVGDGSSLALEEIFYRKEMQLALRNRGMPLEGLRYPITPTGMHYLLVHFDIPEVDAATWLLRLGGLVSKSFSLTLALIHRRTVCRRPAEETKGCASESGIMVLKQKTGPRKGAPDRCYHVTTPTASKSPSTTTAWWPMPG